MIIAMIMHDDYYDDDHVFIIIIIPQISPDRTSERLAIFNGQRVSVHFRVCTQLEDASTEAVEPI